MKKKLKKMMALLLCALLLVSPTAALAEDTGDLGDTGETHVREINITKADIEKYGASTAIQKALNIARFDNEAGDEIKITVEPGSYNLTVALEMYSNTTLDVTDCTFKRSNPDKTYQYNMIRIGIATTADSTDGQLGYANKNVKIIGGTFDGDYRTGTVIKAGHTEGIEITGTTIKNGTNAHLMELAGVRNVVIDGCSFMNQLAVKGDKTLPEVCEEALQIDIPEVTHMANYRSEPLTSTDIVVNNCYFENSPRGVGSHTAILNSPFKRIQVTNCTFKKMTSVAIQTVSWEDSIITGNTITDSPRGIAVYSLLEDGLGTFTASYVAAQGNTTTTIPSTYKAPSKNMNVLIDNNDITLNSTKDSLADYVRLGISVAGNVVTDASHKKWGGVDYAPNGDYYISGVTVTNNKVHTTGHGIRLVDALNCTVKNNTIDCIATTGDTTSYYGIQCFCGSSNSTIESNTINNSVSNGIHVSNYNGAQTSVSIKNNTITNSKKYGISIEDGAIATEISGNKVKKTGSFGINVNGSTATKIYKNEVSNTGGHGFFIVNSKSTSITDNTLTSVIDDGIAISGSTVSNIERNTISKITGTGNLVGVKVYSKGSVKTIKDNTVPDACSIGVYVSDGASVTTVTGNAAAKASKACTYVAPDASITTYESAHLSKPTNSTYTLDKAYVPYIANMKYTWKSSDTKVATVDSKGVVSILRYGNITLTGTGTDGSTIKIPLDAKFWDVNGSNVKGSSNYQYYYDPVYWAASNGITTGYDRVYFGPSKNCSRAELMIFLWRINGSPTGNGDARKYFSDVTADTTTATNKAIAWAYKTGITKGYTEKGKQLFKPDNAITRRETMIMLYRASGKPAVEGSLKFSDCSSYDPASDTYKAILWGSNSGITGGYADGTFGSDLNCLREAIVTFLYRYSKLK